MLLVLLFPVIKDKKGTLSIIEIYGPIALASVLPKVLERILWIDSTIEQFVFKNKHGTDTCFYALKEAVSKKTKNISTMFLRFLNASKAFG